MKQLLQKLLDYLLEEPQVERISQPEDPTLAEKRSKAELWLNTQSREWRNRRNQNALKTVDRAHEGTTP